MTDLKIMADAEREEFAKYAAERSEPAYRDAFDQLYNSWRQFNQEHFEGELKTPHITIGITPPRSLGFHSHITDWGGTTQITIREKFVFGTDFMVISPWPAEGLKRFVDDILLHEMIHQWQHEVSGKTENSYQGHGPYFAKMCNQIGEHYGLADVVAKRRSERERNLPRCAHWPHNIRPDGYYLADIDLNYFLNKKPKHEPSLLLIFESLLAMLDDGRVNDLRDLLEDEIAQLTGEPKKRKRPR